MSPDNEVEDTPVGVAETTRNGTRIFAQIGDGHWYAILPGMEVALRNSGAVVRALDEEPPPSGAAS